MPTGYMPARKNPVRNRRISRVSKLCEPSPIIKFESAPAIALAKKTFEGENRSEIVSRAKVKVPEIKPNCTADVKWLTEPSGRVNDFTRSPITALPANQSDVHANCEKTIIGITLPALLSNIFISTCFNKK
jgi:hypothetical protein